MSIVFVANDTAPSNALGMVAEKLRSRDETVHVFFGGKDEVVLPDDTSMVISGMSHSLTASEQEISALQQAMYRGIRTGLYADTFDCAQRDWFSDFRTSVGLLFVPTESERIKASSFFGNAQIFPVGNPIWQASAFPDLTRTEALTELKILDGQTVIFCPLRKEAGINREHLNLVAEALKSLEKHVVLVGIHPGDPNFKNNPDFYKNSLPPNNRLVTGIPTKNVLPAVDIVVNAASGAGIDAAYQRKPVIDILIESVLVETERLHGRRVWQPVEDGASIGASSSLELRKAVDILLNSMEKRDRLTMAQEKNYPKPTTPRDAVMDMVNYIQLYAG